MAWLLLAVQVWIAHESEKVRPDAAPPAAAAAPRIHLAAAGGECVGAQVVVRGPAPELRVATLASVASLASVARVATMVLEHPSGPEGATGEWPDPLIPARDALFGEARRAFPVDVAAGRSQAVLVEACLPRGTRGRIAGAIRVQ
ncbi:MAG TPA: hypothetical protein VLW85_20285, partial [Myxococcales bacterium]|nr:hypothetical protein [Myxococcales bacterium]